MIDSKAKTVLLDLENRRKYLPLSKFENQPSGHSGGVSWPALSQTWKNHFFGNSEILGIQVWQKKTRKL